MASILFITPRARKDLATAISFLSTRVKSPDEDDWGKLKRVLRYIRGTINLPLILRIDDLGVIKWWIDASFAVHRDMKGHTGATMSLGKGSLLSLTKKQKINTRSSTEAELVGVDDAMPQMLWTRYFIEAQGFKVEEMILNQDNLSTILLEKNGRASSSKRTKHIRVRYYFIKDRIAKGDITVKYCPTEEMLADHFTKPLQGKLFRKFRAAAQGIPLDDTDYGMCPADLNETSDGTGPQECVGEDETSDGQENNERKIVPIGS